MSQSVRFEITNKDTMVSDLLSILQKFTSSESETNKKLEDKNIKTVRLKMTFTTFVLFFKSILEQNKTMINTI